VIDVGALFVAKLSGNKKALHNNLKVLFVD
jgi:hypothetical protein